MNSTLKLATMSALALLMATPSIADAETTGQYIDDTTVTTKVKAALLGDAKLKALHINVQTNQGAVQLGGTVDSKTQESEAIKIANQVDGVKSVEDVMTVRNNQEQ